MTQTLKEKLAGSRISVAAMEARFARADEKAAELSVAFEADAIADIDAVTTALENAKSGPAAREAVAALFRIFHDLKGQGTSFGYPLITQIAAEACDFIEDKVDIPDATQTEILRLHLSSLKLIFVQRVSGPGGVMEAKMIEELSRASAKTSGQSGTP